MWRKATDCPCYNVRFVPQIAVAERAPALERQGKRECVFGPAILNKLLRLAVLMVGVRTEFLTAVVEC
jgi:hypothetical protein